MCGFCGEPIGAGTRSREHLIKKAWLRELGHLQTNMPSDHVSGATGKIISSRLATADKLQAGGVCEDCNNGWMERMDAPISDAMLSMARGLTCPLHYSYDIQRQIARWIFRTGCTYRLMNLKLKELISAETRKALINPAYTPSGLTAFFLSYPPGKKELGTALIQNWEAYGKGIDLKDVQNMKFAIQIDSILLGCVHIDTPLLNAVLLPTHRAFYTNTLFNISRKETISRRNFTEIASVFINQWLAAVGVAKSNCLLNKPPFDYGPSCAKWAIAKLRH